MSILEKKYENGDTELNKFKYKPFMTQGEPPLVTKRIPTGQSPTPQSSNEITKRADDLSRIAQLFIRKEGLGYLTNNTNLNTAVDLSYTVQGTVKDKLKALQEISRGDALKDTLGTLASTLAQVPFTGTGTHFIKGKLFGVPDTSFNKPTRTTARRGDQGAVSVKYGREQYYESLANVADSVNSSSPYEGTSVREYAGSDDYIKFYFQVLRPGESADVFLHFRAYLDSFDDSYSGNWNSFNYVGRGESFHTYQGFSRTITVNFKSAAMTKLELAPMYQKLAYLASTTAPTYNKTNDIMRGTIVRMNIGDYLAETPGFISSVNYSWEPRYPFEIARGKKDPNAPEDTSINTDLVTQEVPHILNCSVSFTPIHTFTPQTGLYHYITNPNNGEYDPFFFEPGEDYNGGAQLFDNLPG